MLRKQKKKNGIQCPFTEAPNLPSIYRPSIWMPLVIDIFVKVWFVLRRYVPDFIVKPTICTMPWTTSGSPLRKTPTSGFSLGVRYTSHAFRLHQIVGWKFIFILYLISGDFASVTLMIVSGWNCHFDIGRQVSVHEFGIKSWQQKAISSAKKAIVPIIVYQRHHGYLYVDQMDGILV